MPRPLPALILCTTAALGGSAFAGDLAGSHGARASIIATGDAVPTVRQPGGRRGIIYTGDAVPTARPSGRLPVRGARWTDVKGRTLTQVLSPIDLLHAPLHAPEGEWAEVTLLLDGPAEVADMTLDLPSLTVVLDEPTGGVALWLDLDLEGLSGADPAAAAGLLENGARLVFSDE